MKSLMQNLGLTKTTFNELLIISNKNIGFLVKFYHGFSEHYNILYRNFTWFPGVEILQKGTVPA